MSGEMKSVNILAEEFVLGALKNLNKFSKSRSEELNFYIKSMREIALGKYSKQVSIAKYRELMLSFKKN